MQTTKKCLEGLLEKELEKLTEPFINCISLIVQYLMEFNSVSTQGHQIYEVYQVSCFGWIVDVTSGQAIAFGGDLLYVAMRDANPSQLKNQSTDYGVMFHTQLMLKKQALVN